MAERMKIRWWQWLPFWSWRLVEVVESADEISERLPRNAISIVGSPDRPKWIAFDCPCRMGHRILINADPKRKPFWQFGVNKRGHVTLAPSVDYSDKAKRCHYIVRDGKIIWAKDTYR